MNIGDRYEVVRLLNPKRFPDSTSQNIVRHTPSGVSVEVYNREAVKQQLDDMVDRPAPQFTILAINADDTVLIQLQDGTRQTESSWFVRHYCKRV